MADCNCGCGEVTAGGAFRPGHDQKLRAELERRAGGFLNLHRLVQAGEEFAAGRLPVEALVQDVRGVFRS